MVQSCCAVNCTQRFEKGVSFHVFPSNAEMRKKWLVAMRREEKWKPKAKDALCYRHFTSDDYNTSGWSSRKSLKKEAVPSIFQFPEHLQKNTKPRPQRKRTSSDAELDIVTVAEATLNESETINTDDCDNVEVEVAGDGNTTNKKRRLQYFGNFSGNVEDYTKEELQVFFELAKNQLEKCTKRTRRLNQTVRRQTKKIDTLEKLVESLQERNLVSPEEAAKLMDSVPRALHDSFVKKELKGKQTWKYSPEMRKFALTLDFYSPRAYEFVREVFGKALPCQRTLQSWYKSVDCEPGFNEEALKTLQMKCKNKHLLFSLMFDEMSIRKHIVWDGTRFVGYATLTNEDRDDGIPAKEALVFMLNCVNERWKIPVGYFLISSINATRKANLINTCLNLLHTNGVKVIALTFDGAATNLSMCRYLGACFEVDNLEKFKTFFSHPVTKEPIYIFFDPSHALKLVRNALATYKTFIDGDGVTIRWSDFENLVEKQEAMQLHVGCKATRRHVQWQREKMRVRLAAQTFSESTARGMRYLRERFGFPDSRGTETFFSTINNIFDIMNSRNKYGKYYKRGLQRNNEEFIFTELVRIKNYILNLKDQNQNLICNSGRRTGFVGFLICIESLISLYAKYVLQERTLLYILTYKFSQDHLEVFFSAIRSKNGYNNNPSAVQFKAAYKRLLMHTAIKGRNGNCEELEETPISILFSRSGDKSKPTSTKGQIKIPLAILDLDLWQDDVSDENEDEELENIINDHCYAVTYGYFDDTYVTDVTAYIAGFVVKVLQKRVLCETCYEALLSTDEPNFLLNIKNYGGDNRQYLTNASADVIYLCKMAEQTIRVNETKLCTIKNVMTFLIVHTLRRADDRLLFPSLVEHATESIGGNAKLKENHVQNLIKLIIFKYLTIRLYHHSSLINEKIHRQRVRSLCTKSVLFKNQ